MKMTRTLLPAILIAAVSLPALAVEGGDIARKNNCLACHALDKKLVGPAFKSVAEKYKGDAEAPARLMATVKAGGKGVWGPVAMPANPRLSDEDLKTVVAWVLAQ